jgi:hypothetical protein
MKGALSVRSSLLLVWYKALTLVERIAISAVQTPEQGVEDYISKITAAQAGVDECTPLVAAECALNYLVVMLAATIND